MRLLEVTVFVLCSAYVSCGDLNNIAASSANSGEGAVDYSGSYSGGYDASQQISQGYGDNVAYSQQNVNFANYGGYSTDQGHQEYQVQEIASNHIGDVQGGQYGGANSYQNGDLGFQPSYGGIATANYGHAEPQVIHTQAEAIPISKHVEITKSVPYPVYKQLHVPVQRPVNVHIPHPVLVPAPHPYPIHIPVTKPVAVSVHKEITIPIEKIVPFPVYKKVPYVVEKHVPYHVEKVIPVKIPVVKTIIHRVNTNSHYGGSYGHGHGHGYGHGHGHGHGWH